MSNFVPEKVAFKSFVGGAAVGKTLLGFLADRFTYFDRERWRTHIDSRDVLVNGQNVQSEFLLKAGDEVQYMAMTRPEPRIPTQIPVLFEDEDLLIVNKPPHIPVHPGGRYLRHTLIHLLQKQRKLDLLILSHRLDRETSGVCVLTKTHLAKEKMYWQFFKHEVEKTYWALCWGKLNPPSTTVDAPIGDALGHGSRIRIKKMVGGGNSKSAKTKIHTLSVKQVLAPTWIPPQWPGLKDHKAGDPWPISLVECKPITGRTNQIRVHLAHLGCGILGDKLYDPDESVFIEMRETPPVLENKTDGRGREKPVGFMNLSEDLQRRLVLDAHALHAKSLKFRHPRSGKTMLIEAAAPKSWQGLYNRP